MPTMFFGVPLIAAAQAQKHVTANEQADLLAVIAAGVVVSATTAAPLAPGEGSASIVPPAATFTDVRGGTLDAGALAIRYGGGWIGGAPPVGHSVRVLDEGRSRVYVGAGIWRAGSVLGPETGAPLGLAVIDAQVVLSGPSVTAPGLIPERAIILGVTSWVIDAVTGATSYSVGVTGDPGKFGAALGLASGSSNVGVVGPFATYTPADVVVTATDGGFMGGVLGLAVAAILPGAPQ